MLRSAGSGSPAGPRRGDYSRAVRIDEGCFDGLQLPLGLRPSGLGQEGD